MTTERDHATSSWRTRSGTPLTEAARDHLWMHFTAHGGFEGLNEQELGRALPVIVRGQGHRIWDDHGREYIDALAGLFVVNAGHGRGEIVEAMAKQASELAYFPLWSYAHPQAIELAERLAAQAPADLNRVFFTTVVARQSRAPGSSPNSISSSPANRPSTRSSPGPSPTTAPRRARSH